MIRLLLFVSLALALVIQGPVADADVGNVGGIAPGLCEYPAICAGGAEFGAYDYSEAWPTEINGSHRQCLLGGAMFSGTAGVSFMFVNASVTTPLGVIRGACWYACPDPVLSSAEMPNPPGAWKNEIHPPKCKPIGPAPVPVGAPPPPDDAPPPPPPPPPPFWVPPASEPLPSVTTPIAPDPLGTGNSGNK